MEAFEIPELDPQPRDSDGHGYVDFLASDKLSVGLAVWLKSMGQDAKTVRDEEMSRANANVPIHCHRSAPLNTPTRDGQRFSLSGRRSLTDTHSRRKDTTRRC